MCPIIEWSRIQMGSECGIQMVRLLYMSGLNMMAKNNRLWLAPKPRSQTKENICNCIIIFCIVLTSESDVRPRSAARANKQGCVKFSSHVPLPAVPTKGVITQVVIPKEGGYKINKIIIITKQLNYSKIGRKSPVFECF